ncbi:MAG: hypothetical protein AAFY72_01815 [Cyanobacteria bacterium J06649_4]
MVYSIFQNLAFQSFSDAKSKKRRLVSAGLLLLTFFSTLGIFVRINQTNKNSKLVNDAVKVQSQVQQLTQIAQFQLASTSSAQTASSGQGAAPARPTAESTESIVESVQTIDQLLNAQPHRISDSVLQTEWEQILETWPQLKADFESGLSETTLDRAQISARLGESEEFSTRLQQVVERAERYAQTYGNQTGQLLWLVFLLPVAAIAYLLYSFNKRQKDLSATVESIAATSSNVSTAVAQQSQLS